MSEAEKVRKPAGNRGQGRKPGVPNKVTTEFRDTIRRLLEDNAENIAKWLAQVANGQPAVYDSKGQLLRSAIAADPAGALSRLGHLAEFAAPKLTRSEVSGPDGGPLQVTVTRLG